MSGDHGGHLSTRSTIGDILDHPSFAGFSRLILPWDDRAYDENMPLTLTRGAAYGGGDLPRPSAIVMAYTGHSDHSQDDPPTFVVVGEDDRIAPPSIMERRVEALRRSGTVVEYRRYENLGHGFGTGVGTSAEGWIVKANRFWERSIRR